MNTRFICGLGTLIVGLLLCAMGLGLLFSPIQYRATAQIKIEPDMISDVPYEEAYAPYDPYFFQTEMKVIESDKVLSNVVRDLKLDEIWGKRYSHGGTMEMDEAVPLLRRRLELKSSPNTRLVEIGVWDEDPALAARMANGIYDAYRDYRKEMRLREMAAGLELLKKSYQEETGDITNQAAQLAQLRRQAGITDPEPADDMLVKWYPDYYAAKGALAKKENLHALLKAKIESIENDASIPRTPLVEMVEPADAATVARSQNHLWGAICFIGGLAMSFWGGCSIKSSRRVATVGT